VFKILSLLCPRLNWHNAASIKRPSNQGLITLMPDSFLIILIFPPMNKLVCTYSDKHCHVYTQENFVTIINISRRTWIAYMSIKNNPLRRCTWGNDCPSSRIMNISKKVVWMLIAIMCTQQQQQHVIIWFNIVVFSGSYVTLLCFLDL